MKRKRNTERATPCEICNYPISQRHHLMPICEYGENEYCLNLCANCHELYHIIDNALSLKGHIKSEDSSSFYLMKKFYKNIQYEDIFWELQNIVVTYKKIRLEIQQQIINKNQ